MRYVKFLVLIICIVTAGCSTTGSKDDAAQADAAAGSKAAAKANTAARSKAAAQAGSSSVSSIKETDWLLIEIRTGGKTIDLNREKLKADNMGDWFSLRFDNENRVAGMGAPNRYTAPCEWGNGSSLSVGLIASTMMFAFREPEALNENQFFAYLAKVKSWEIDSQGRLELHTQTETEAAILVFEK